MFDDLDCGVLSTFPRLWTTMDDETEGGDVTILVISGDIGDKISG